MSARSSTVLLVALFSACAAGCAVRPFVSERWRLADGSPSPGHASAQGVRLAMAEWLVASRVLVGKTCDELWGMLGPEDIAFVIQCPGFGGSRWFHSAWDLGLHETRHLEVRYGDNGQASEFRIH